MHGTKCGRPKLFMLFAALSLIGLLCTLFMAQEEIRTIVHYLAPLENTKAYVQKYKARQHFTESNRSYILMWRPPWGIADQAVPEGTRIGNCTLTFDRSMLPRAGAVIFHYTDNSIPIPWRLHRDIGQYFVFYSIESPSFMLNVERKTFQNLDNFFNLTMTYKEGSEKYSDVGRNSSTR
uniref:alpha-(1,3)-fucosyltransferase 5-like n=1 Tax=Ciona intestinalis TaxID=7719 RepID=UPI000EF44770|nr:alpha-(1,3)-fucosyltransferase 5-like [Ciona intestinalis]|eukprot:XP_026689461.1 alpha-(1,3)-fucosyltransferase 5-like [Ciona intestinalis]